MRAIVYAALAGVGDKSRQWEEYTGYGFHLRRRLTEEEQASIGEAVDLRGSRDARMRFEAIKDLLPSRAVAMALEEIG